MDPNIKSILAVVNPIAGGNDKSQLIHTLEETATRKGFKLHLYKTTGNKDKEAIQELITQNHPDRIFVAGGDGTISLLASMIQDTSIPIAVFPTGSANGLALNLNLPEDLEAQIEVGLGEHFIDMDMLQLGDHLCLHIADIGLNASLIKNYDKSNIRGFLGYMLQSIPTIAQEDYPYQFKIEANGETFIHEGIMLAIANAEKFGTGATINPGAQMDDGLFEILVFKNLNAIEIARSIYDKVDLNSDFVACIKTRTAHISSDVAIDFQIDGECMGKTQHITATLCKSKLKIAIP